jgi:predicted alpha/beta-hydrolase family hydrolase
VEPFDVEALRLPIAGATSVSALLCVPPAARACLVLAHGAGAGMTHVFMARASDGLAARGVATLRFQFPYMERGSKRPDAPPVAHAAVRAAVHLAAQRLPGLPLFAGGKSFGGRMSSQAQALEPLPGVLGLVFFGFPLHPAGKPSLERAEHLDRVHCPLLFLQGTRDALAEPALLHQMHAGLGAKSTLFEIDDADHSFHVRASSGSDDAQVMAALLDAAAGWMARAPTGAGP